MCSKSNRSERDLDFWSGPLLNIMKAAHVRGFVYDNGLGQSRIV